MLTKPRIGLWAGLLALVLLVLVAIFGGYLKRTPPPATARLVPAQKPSQPATHQALASMPWYDGIVYLRNNHVSVTPYLPVVRAGLRSTENWALHLREAYLLSNSQPWGELSGVLIEAIMVEVARAPKGPAQAAKGAELFGLVFIGQPEALIAQKLLWEENQQSGLRFAATAQVLTSIQASPTSPETQWLMEQAAGTFTADATFLNDVVQSAWLRALPAGHPAKREATAEIAWDQLQADIGFERQLAALPLPNEFAELAGGTWDTPWRKLRALEFQMRRFYLTANGFAGNTTRISALSVDAPDTLQSIAAHLRDILQAARKANP